MVGAIGKALPFLWNWQALHANIRIGDWVPENFAHYGGPETLASEKGPQFSSYVFKDFVKKKKKKQPGPMVLKRQL